MNINTACERCEKPAILGRKLMHSRRNFLCFFFHRAIFTYSCRGQKSNYINAFYFQPHARFTQKINILSWFWFNLSLSPSLVQLYSHRIAQSFPAQRTQVFRSIQEKRTKTTKHVNSRRTRLLYQGWTGFENVPLNCWLMAIYFTADEKRNSWAYLFGDRFCYTFVTFS